MYEIWLMLNIVWELALTIWPWLVALAVLWLLLMARAWRRERHQWRASLPGALVLGLAVAILIFVVTPGWNKSGLGEMKYWVDWANLLGIAVAWGVAAVALAWPLLTGGRRRQGTNA